jgi:hypothetical protein
MEGYDQECTYQVHTRQAIVLTQSSQQLYWIEASKQVQTVKQQAASKQNNQNKAIKQQHAMILAQ